MANNRVYIFDTTTRDAAQSAGQHLTTAQKVAYAQRAEILGVDIIEAGFPISSPGDFKSVVEIGKATKRVKICALTRAVNKDIDEAARALSGLPMERRRIHTGIGTSDPHIQFKFHSNREDIIERAKHAVTYARQYVQDVEFYAEDAGRTDKDYLARVVEAVIAAGATVVNIPDTTGYCLPDVYGDKINYLFNNVPNIDRAIISTHCHNDLGMATANTMAGLLNGARQAEVTMMGLGERAGNTSLEEIVMIMKCHHTLGFVTGINSEYLFPTAELVSQIFEEKISPRKPIIGSKVFSHSSGIHQDGVLKNKNTYEILDPKQIGMNLETISKTNLILTAQSGKGAVGEKLRGVGICPTPEELVTFMDTKFLPFADAHKQVDSLDLYFLWHNKHVEDLVELVNMSYDNEKGAVRVTVTLRKDKNVESQTVAVTEGTGLTDAAFRAVNCSFPRLHITLENYESKSATPGSNARGIVDITITVNGVLINYSADDLDLNRAGVNAYVGAINKYINYQQ